MYLNVNLTPPPPAAGESSCTTPKTPEILNSLINLTSPPLPSSYAQYQVEGGALMSPVSEMSSPSSEESPVMPHGKPTYRSKKDPLTPIQSGLSGCQRGYQGGGGGGGGMVGGSPGTSGIGGPLAGASPPSTPDLPSPVNTVEATKSALIKEGLKLQIKTKLQAAGVDQDDALDDDTKFIKGETDELTEEDEERRRRRRERNKIAATKCRNKKKEKTMVLMTESESVEDINLRLKTEIQRLTSEKNKLEKLLRDPNHRASCRHSPRCSKAPRPPIVIVTPADSPDTSPSSSSCSSSSSLGSPTSPPLTSPTSYKAFSQVPPCTSSSPSSTSCAATSSSSHFLAPKYNPSQSMNQRHHPYQIPGRPQLSPTSLGEKQQYCNPPSPTNCQSKQGYMYPCMNVPRTHEFTPPNLPPLKSVYATSKSRNAGQVRYSPYGGRTPPVPSPLATHNHPQADDLAVGDTFAQSTSNNGCGREDQQTFVTDMHTNQFFPPCSYSGM